jgi:hypothetical protein
MKLYWRYKKDGKWTWKPVGPGSPPEWLDRKLHDVKEVMEEEE